jgi:ferredoxin-thioredoxin reductase catalytic subunit
VSDKVSREEINGLYQRLKEDAEAGGYHLNPDPSFTMDLARGLLINEKRYGYQTCPCRLAVGVREEDRDIICPCDYRDPDLNDWNNCYCCLYVTRDVVEGREKTGPIPERRGSEEAPKTPVGERDPDRKLSGPSVPVWRCRVCGYLCAREHPPQACPICKVDQDRFEPFL